MTAPPACPNCAAALAEDQRYCVACGVRVVAADRPPTTTRPAVPPTVPPRRRGAGFIPRLPVPDPRQSAVLFLVALSTGAVIGDTTGPSPLAAGPAREVLVMAPVPSAQTPSPPAASSALAAAPALGRPLGNVADAPAPAQSGADSAEAPESTPSPPAETPAPQAKTPDDTTTTTTPTDTPAGGGDTGDGSDEAIPLSGAVVHRNDAGHSYAVATAAGELLAVHAKKPPPVGRLVRGSVHQLANGTYGEDRRTLGTAVTRAKLRGTVSFVAPAMHAYVISVRGASMAVTVPVDQPLPALRGLVTTDVLVQPAAPATGQLQQTAVVADGSATGPIDIEAPIQAIDTASRAITLAADDIRTLGADITVQPSAKIDLGSLEPGDVVSAAVTIAPDGTYGLEAVVKDGDAKEADAVTP